MSFSKWLVSAPPTLHLFAIWMGQESGGGQVGDVMDLCRIYSLCLRSYVCVRQECVIWGMSAHCGQQLRTRFCSRPVSPPDHATGLRSNTHHTLSFLANTLTPLRWVTARSTAYSSPISTNAVPGTLFMNFTCTHNLSALVSVIIREEDSDWSFCHTFSTLP